MSNDREKIIERIKKLMAVAEDRGLPSMKQRRQRLRLNV